MTRVVKRDGNEQNWDREKIIRACLGAGADSKTALHVAKTVETKVGDVIEIEDLHQQVIDCLPDEIATSYSAYKAERDRYRLMRETPDVEAISNYILASKYAHYDIDIGHLEDWTECWQRNRDMHKRKYPQLADEIDALYEEWVKPKKVLPAMRSLQFGGRAIEVNNTRMYNCLGRETQFITSEGVKSFEDFEDGDEVTVLSHTGAWRRAVVRCYGEQNLNLLHIRSGKKRYQAVRATGEHRWYLDDGSVTDDICHGENLLKAPIAYPFDFGDAEYDEKVYWCYGFVYGDGTCNNGGSMVRLCAQKDEEYLPRFEECGFKTSGGDSIKGTAYAYTGRYKKTLPDLTKEPLRKIKAFVAGYLAADGHRDRNKPGHYHGIQCSNPEGIAFLRQALPMCGYYIVRERDLTGEVTNFAVRGETIWFDIIDNTSTATISKWKVEYIERDVAKEDVWCLEVEEDYSFCLPSGIVTGNCWFGHCDNIKFFHRLFFILLSGGGVGYSVQQHHVAKLPEVLHVSQRQIYIHKVEDTIEGWGRAAKVLLESYFETGIYVEFDYSGVRSEGSWLHTTGGRAPGHVPLKIALEKVRGILETAAGRQLIPFEAHRIACSYAEGVLSGGIRRSSLIALFSLGDQTMMRCKAKGPDEDPDPAVKPRWMIDHPELRMANNSALLLRNEVTWEQFSSLFEWTRHYGEPGFFFTDDLEYGCNPCGEIGLFPRLPRSFQACNLVEVNCATVVSPEDFVRRCEAASKLATLQAGYTDLNYVGSKTEEVVKAESLIGVGLCGIMDSEICRDPNVLNAGVLCVNATNRAIADLIGIPHAARTTTIKPGGTSSLFLGCIASGIHTHPWRRYFRLITANKNEPVFQWFQKHNPHMCQQKPDNDWVIRFPVQVPSTAVVQDDLSAKEFLDTVFMVYENWITPGTTRSDIAPDLTNNISCTVPIGSEEEWDEVINHVWANRNRIAAQSYLATYGQPQYDFMPRTKVELTEADEVLWNTIVRQYQKVDYTKMPAIVEDAAFDKGAACEGGKCEV